MTHRVAIEIHILFLFLFLIDNYTLMTSDRCQSAWRHADVDDDYIEVKKSLKEKV